MINKINNIILPNTSNSAQDYALDLVSSVIQSELAIGYCLEVSAISNTHVDITVISPEICCPATVKVPLNQVTKNEQLHTWKQIKKEISENLKR